MSESEQKKAAVPSFRQTTAEILKSACAAVVYELGASGGAVADLDDAMSSDAMEEAWLKIIAVLDTLPSYDAELTLLACLLFDAVEITEKRQCTP